MKHIGRCLIKTEKQLSNKNKIGVMKNFDLYILFWEF